MMIKSNFPKDFRPQFSGHETFPMKYGWLKKAFDEVYVFESNDKKSDSKNVFLDDESISRFGVGKNMVASIRHWATASGILFEDQDKDLLTTELAKTLFSKDGLDPWMENLSTIWLLHWNIVTQSPKAAYAWLFNDFNGNQFDRATVTNSLLQLCDKNGWSVSPTTLKRDVECLVRAYVRKPVKSGGFNEDQIESPLSELGLIKPLNKNDTFKINRGEQPTLGTGVFLYCLVEFWKQNSSSSRTLSLESITFDRFSPGRTLCLDEDAVASRLYGIEEDSGGAFAWSETAGLRQVIANKPVESINPLSFIDSDYVSETNLKKVS